MPLEVNTILFCFHRNQEEPGPPQFIRKKVKFESLSDEPMTDVFKTRQVTAPAANELAQTSN